MNYQLSIGNAPNAPYEISLSTNSHINHISIESVPNLEVIPETVREISEIEAVLNIPNRPHLNNQ